MADFEKEVEEINSILQKGDEMSFAAAEIRAERLKAEVQRSECLEREARIATVEVILGTAQAFLGKFDSALKNLESALKKHVSFEALSLGYWNMAYKMLIKCRNRANMLPEARGMMMSFGEFRDVVRSEFGE
ncbi:MAG: hypothetical protein WC788_06895 [Candidatus Paceibacterota bacterium]|jgi:hypothetical protein